jgi:hypothetical protein
MEGIDYRNDEDFNALVSADITEDRLITFIIRKGGKVNLTNLTFLVRERSKTDDVVQQIRNMISDGILKKVDSHYFKLTFKGRLNRIYKSPAWIFWLLVISVMLSLLAIIF